MIGVLRAIRRLLPCSAGLIPFDYSKCFIILDLVAAIPNRHSWQEKRSFRTRNSVFLIITLSRCVTPNLGDLQKISRRDLSSSSDIDALRGSSLNPVMMYPQGYKISQGHRDSSVFTCEAIFIGLEGR